MGSHTNSIRDLGDLLNLPSALRLLGPRGLMWWQWIAIPVVIVIAWFVGKMLGRLTLALLSRLTARTTFTWDEQLVARLGSPVALAWTLGAVALFTSWLSLPDSVAAWLQRWIRGGFFAVFFLALARSVDIGHQFVLQTTWAQTRPGSRSVLPIVSRLAKVVVFTLAVVSLLSELGYPVTSLVAGLGIGGLALALAAQKTVENLFGTLSISADQPLREGDFVKIDDSMGNVESIGLRSTRIRTLDRTIITIPNGKLADLRIETFAPRDRVRLACTLSLAYGTSGAQMREVLAAAEAHLRAHPKIWPDSITVRLKEFATSSLDIEVMAWFQTADYGEFQGYRQDVLLGFMDIVEKSGTALAVPTRSVRLSGTTSTEPP